MVACLKAKFSDPIVNIFIFLWQSFMSDRWHIQVLKSAHCHIQVLIFYLWNLLFVNLHSWLI